MRLTSDISLLHDNEYLKYVKEFASDFDSFNTAFDEAWFDLTTKYGSGTWADNAKCDDGEFPEELRHVENPDVSEYKDLYMLGDDFTPPRQTPSSSTIIIASTFGLLASALIGFVIKRRSSRQPHILLAEEEEEVEQLVHE